MEQQTINAPPSLEELRDNFKSLDEQARRLRDQVAWCVSTIRAQDEIIQLAIDQLELISRAEAVAPFFRLQVVGTCDKIKAIIQKQMGSA